MEAFDTVYTNVQASVKNADEIEWTVDALYSGWFHINAFFCLGICTGNVFGDKLSEMKKQRDAVEKIAFDPSRILSTPKNGKGVNSDTAETQEPQTYSNLKERFFIGSFANVGVGENNAVSGRIKCVQHSEKFS